MQAVDQKHNYQLEWPKAPCYGYMHIKQSFCLEETYNNNNFPQLSWPPWFDHRVWRLAGIRWPEDQSQARVAFFHTPLSRHLSHLI